MTFEEEEACRVAFNDKVKRAVEFMASGAPFRQPAHVTSIDAVRPPYVVGLVIPSRSSDPLPALPQTNEPFFDGRIVPGFGSATKTTIDLGTLREKLLAAIAALTAVYDALEVAP